MSSMNTIAIIGGGYSGISIILNLQQQVMKPTKVVLFEKHTELALGAAYSTGNPAHLLNVRANNMSAFADKPNHFVEWLSHDKVAQQYLDKSQPIGLQFLPRCIYGRYLQSLWRETREAPHANLQIEVHHEEVIDVNRVADASWQLKTAQGHCYDANVVILATGHSAPQSFAEKLGSGRVLNNPWQDGVLNQIAPDEEVLIIGTGLTMVDMVMSLHTMKHAGKIYAIARRGCLPQRHQLFEMQDVWSSQKWPTQLTALTRFIRAKVRELKTQGHDWRSVVDSLRPHTHAVWQSLSKNDQARFLRHLVPYWDTHRHRIAENVADIIDAAIRSGRLQIIAGRLSDVKVISASQLLVHYHPRGKHQQQRLTVNWVVNCTGPNTRYDKIANPLFQSLLKKELIMPDDLGLGLLTNADGKLLNQQSLPSGELYTLAVVCKPLLWECIAVPDIRQQSLSLAKKLARM